MHGPRAVKSSELDELMELVNSVFRAGEGRMRECFPTLFSEENLDNVRIIREDGKIVSHIGVCVRDVISQGIRFTVGNVGAVCTDPNYRKRGHAQTLLRHFNDKLRAEGVDLLFVSGDRSLYRRHGCAHVGRVLSFSLKDSIHHRKSIQVQLLDPARVGEWARLHQQEPVRFHRPLDDWRKLVANGPVHRFLRSERRFYEIADASGRKAYCVFHLDAESKGTICEYAGPRDLISGAASLIREQSQVSQVVVPAPDWDRPLIRLLENQGLSYNLVSAGGTVCILNLPQLADRLRPLMVERISQKAAEALRFAETNDAWSVSLGEETLRFRRDESGEGWMDVARLIFGTPDDSHLKDRPDNDLTRALKEVFPIARPEYGLSYI